MVTEQRGDDIQVSDGATVKAAQERLARLRHQALENPARYVSVLDGDAGRALDLCREFRPSAELVKLLREIVHCYRLLAAHFPFPGEAGPHDLKVAHTRELLADALWAVGRPTEAMATVQEALADYRRFERSYVGEDGFPRIIAMVLGNTGLRLKGVGRYDDAIDYMRRSLQTFGSVEGPNQRAHLAMGWANLGSAFAAAGRYGEACDAFNKAIALTNEANFEAPDIRSKLLAASMSDLALSLKLNGRSSDAIRVGREAVQLFREAAERLAPWAARPNLARLLLNLSNALWDNEDYEDAIRAQEEAIACLRTLPRPTSDDESLLSDALASFSSRLAWIARLDSPQPWMRARLHDALREQLDKESRPNRGRFLWRLTSRTFPFVALMGCLAALVSMPGQSEVLDAVTTPVSMATVSLWTWRYFYRQRVKTRYWARLPRFWEMLVASMSAIAWVAVPVATTLLENNGRFGQDLADSSLFELSTVLAFVYIFVFTIVQLRQMSPPYMEFSSYFPDVPGIPQDVRDTAVDGVIGLVRRA